MIVDPSLLPLCLECLPTDWNDDVMVAWWRRRGFRGGRGSNRGQGIRQENKFVLLEGDFKTMRSEEANSSTTLVGKIEFVGVLCGFLV